MRRVSFEDVGVNYNTIAIIGPQSSGKSTLLNKLFDTKFEVMDSTIRRGQTTKGVLIAADFKSKVFIIDCEGTDSKSRSEEDRGKFEHSSSLFSLAMSDILIINMWTSDVGRYTASNYGVLKIVFEMNLKLFEQKTAKKIIIFLRDFDPGRNRKDKIESLILEDIHKIWKEIKLPQKFEGKGPENFFSFEFITLPHLIYRKDDFDKEIQDLRKRLDKTNEKYFFSNLSSIKNVPADGLKQYVNQIWKEILSDKDLDIPSQREMLANYRCTEIKNKILLSYEKEIKELIKQSNEKNIENLKDICIDINNRMCSEYEKQAGNYLEKVYKNIYNQLKEQISQKLYVCFLNQTKRLIPIIQKFMRDELQKKLAKIDDNNDDYITIATNLKKKYLTQLLTKLESKKAFESWKSSEKEFSNLFDEIIEDQKKKALNKLKLSTIDKLRTICEQLFNISLDNYSKDNNFWKDFNENYLNHFCSKMFPSKIIEQFKKKFCYEKSSGYREQKNWERYEELEIDLNFKSLRDEYLPIFDQLKFFELMKNILSEIKFENYPDKIGLEMEECKKIVEKYLQKNNFEVLLKQGDILSLKKKFEMGISDILEDIKRKKEGFQINMPYWFYALLLFFGYDDVFKIIKSWFIVPIIIIIGIYLLLVKLKKDWIIKDTYFLVEEKADKIYRKVKKFIDEKYRTFKLRYNFSI